MHSVAAQRIRGVLNARCLLACLGLTLYWPMLRSPFLGTALATSAYNLLDLRLTFDLVLLLMGVAALTFTSTASKISSLIEANPLSGPAFGLVAALGSAALLQWGSSPLPALQVAALAGAAILACGFVLLSFTWAHSLAFLKTDEALVCMHVSFLASFLFGLFDFFPLALDSLCLILPLGSGVAAYAFRKRVSDNQACSIGDWVASTFDSRQLVFAIIFAMVIGLVACGILRSLWISTAVSYKPSAGILPTYAISISIATCLLLLLLFIPGRRRSLLIGLVLLFCALLVAIILCSSLGFKPALSLTASVRTSFEFYLWCFLVVLGMDQKRFGIRLWDSFFVINPLSLLLTSYALPCIFDINPHNSGAYATGLSVLSLFIVAIAFIIIAAAFIWRIEKNWEGGGGVFRQVENVGGITPSLNGKRDTTKLLVERFGLTEREAEIAEYLACGHSMKKTAAHFHLAHSTVQSHAKSIYRKMGINSKQSLIDEVSKIKNK